MAKQAKGKTQSSLLPNSGVVKEPTVGNRDTNVFSDSVVSTPPQQQAMNMPEAFMFQQPKMADGGLLQEGGTVDPVSGNDVPAGSLKEEVRDDIPAKLSEGEFVFPADVVRFVGLERLMKIRQKAKEGLAKMEAMGQMGNADEATMEDDEEFESEIDDIIDEIE